MRHPSLPLALCALAGLVAGCSSAADRARADSAQTLVIQQGQLLHQLTAQRDSVSQVLGQADAFIGKIDSSISKVKGLPKGHAPKNEEGPLEAQVRQRQEMLRRVNALVERARETARQVADLKERE
jgi:hypothetical protein